ncbi:MAG: carbohydrate ABC transporter permease [Vallitaleaceae bacterium]|nr:carbohydrate ABC transporter permease [Vallitaleaceae bacterium]
MNDKKKNKAVLYIVLSLIAFIWLLPILFMILTSLKAPGEIATGNFFGLPKIPQWSNFYEAWTQGQLGLFMKNSLIIATIKVPLGIFIEAMAAYALTKINIKSSTKMKTFIFFLIGMTVPVQVIIVPLNVFLINIHLTNSRIGLMLIYLGLGIPFGIMILRGFFRTIPDSLVEAARIDGCSDFRTLVSIILPIAKPAIVTLVILDFLSTWNEFLLSSVFITKEHLKTIPTGLFGFVGQHTTDYGLLNAAVLMSVIPVFIVYLVFQKHFIAGLEGSVKG